MGINNRHHCLYYQEIQWKNRDQPDQPVQSGNSNEERIQYELPRLDPKDLIEAKERHRILSKMPHQFELEDAINKFVNNVISYIKIPHKQAEIVIAQSQDGILGTLVPISNMAKCQESNIKSSLY